MKYTMKCLFAEGIQCPLQEFNLDIDGGLCSACVDIQALEGAFKAQVVSRLLMTFHDPKKAKEAFDEIMKCVKEW